MGTDAVEQFDMVSAWKVGATYALLEEYIAAEQAAALGLEKGNMSGGVPRYEHHVELKAPELQAAGILPPHGRSMAAIHRNTPGLRSAACLIQRKVKTMQPERQAGMFLHDAGYCSEVIEVRVSEPDCVKSPPAARYATQNLRRIPGWVNDYTVIATVIGDYEAIGEQWAEGQFFDLQHDFRGTQVRILQCSGTVDYISTAAGQP